MRALRESTVPRERFSRDIEGQRLGGPWIASETYTPLADSS
jgi:hypothetical protein